MELDPIASLATAVAVHESRIGTLEQEQARARQRLHDFEGDRATLRLLTTRVADLASGVERIAEAAATRAVEIAFEHRDKLAGERSGRRLQYAAVGAAVGGFISAIVFHLT